MVLRGWVNVSLKANLVERVDAFLKDNKWGFSNRAEVVTTAVREFLQRHQEAPPEPEKLPIDKPSASEDKRR